ncbi:MAG: hypothetical protein H7839_15280 [Magnetococcus sp. YQC-5]
MAGFGLYNDLPSVRNSAIFKMNDFSGLPEWPSASPKEHAMTESTDKAEQLKTAFTQAQAAWALCRTAHIRQPTPATASAVDSAFDDLYDAEDAWKAYLDTQIKTK